MNIAVLGCGPAGLMAADAAWGEGHEINIFAPAKKSPIAGAQFVHAKTGWYCSTTHDLEVDVIKVGSGEGYAYNVYGDMNAPSSWPKFQTGKLFGWDMKLSYDRLWDRYGELIENETVTAERLMELLKLYDKVISSIPLPFMCYGNHDFKHQDVFIVHGEADEVHKKSGDMMYYNGLPDSLGVFPGQMAVGPAWYRFSQLNGYQAWEYAIHKVSFETLVENKGDDQEVASVRKAVSTNCDCWSDVIRVGRYGCWDKNVLTHHVREQVLNALQ